MKKKMTKIISLLLSVVMVFSIGCTGVFAADESSSSQAVTINEEQLTEFAKETITETADTVKGLFAGMASLTSWDAFMDNTMKVLYNSLNVIVEALVSSICAVYPDPVGWKNISDDDEVILEGDTVYRTTPASGAHWSLGYASKSLVPADVSNGEYYLGRDLLNKKAIDVYDDMRIRICAIDDNSGDGISVFGAIDCLGVTSTDVRTVREAIIEYCAGKGYKLNTLDICATHCHSALDTQGVSTEFFYKLAANIIFNFFKIDSELPGMEYAAYFKKFFVEQSILAAQDALNDMKDGKLFYDVIDASSYVKDKRGLISSENLPKTVALKFVPNDVTKAGTYIANVTCHPTSFSAGNGYVNGDYTYYLDQYIKEKTGYNFILCQGALGQVSREIDVDTTGMDEYTEMSASARTLGQIYGKDIISAAYKNELAPILNVKHKEIFNYPENSILTLACEIKLVNNPVYYTEDGTAISTEIGYMEFGHEIGFAMFPGEFYPETFWGTDIIGNVSWDGTEWQYDSLHDSVKDIKVYPISLCDDATGYVVPDNYFAFMGHIIGDGIADETLSVGKHQASFLIGNYLDMVNSFTK